MFNTTLQVSALALAGALSGSTILSAAAEEDRSAAAVLDHHVHAFAAGDLDAMLADYTEDSVFITPQGVLTGPAEIRPLFEAMIEESLRRTRVPLFTSAMPPGPSPT